MNNRIYVAGSSKEVVKVKAYIAALECAGFRITYDWTKAVEANPSDHALSPDEAEQHALTDIKGVDEADIFWLILPEGKSEGAHFELGYAYAAGVERIIVSGAHTGRIFCYLLDIERWEKHDNAFVAITSRADLVPGVCTVSPGCYRPAGHAGECDRCVPAPDHCPDCGAPCRGPMRVTHHSLRCPRLK